MCMYFSYSKLDSLQASQEFAHAALEAGAKPAGGSPFSNWDISPYTGSGFSDMVVDGAL